MADEKISELPEKQVSEVNGQEEIPVADNGSNFKITTETLSSYVGQFIDGGNSSSVYLSNQIIDGGNA